MAHDVTSIPDIFGPGGILDQHLRGFEYRAGQERMAEAVLDVLVEGGRLLVEAGTGTGKTLAYLIPAALSGRKVVVSTGTKNLQDQILSKEIPFLQENLFPGLKVACLKGKKNYLCRHRWSRVQMQSEIPFSEQQDLWPRLTAWMRETAQGDRAELDWLPDSHPIWNDISSSAEQCLGSACTEAESCYINLLRKEAARADIVVVNHHLFFSDMVVRESGYGEVIPRYEAVVFDEAHHLEDVATLYLGYSVSNYRILELVRDAEQETNAGGLAARQKAEILKTLGELRGRVDAFFALLPAADGRLRLRRRLMKDGELGPVSEALGRGLLDQGKRMEDLAAKSEAFLPIGRRFFDMAREFTSIVEAREEDMVYWLERRQRATSLAASPLSVADTLQERLYSQVRSLVFTSATLTVQGRFDFFESRLGLESDAEKMSVASPFDYGGNALLYIPTDLPEPASAVFCAAIAREIEKILEASSGRALVLFTSYRNMEEVYRLLDGVVPFRLLVQGQKPRSVLLEAFQSDVYSVLLATNSFWEGIDVPGESLSCVIIDKLPFGVPSDPVLESRLEWLNKQGKNPFVTYQLPLAVLSLRQGFGRLIRSGRDRGVLAILDVRTLRRQYGRVFLQSLPQMPVTHELDEVGRFFQGA